MKYKALAKQKVKKELKEMQNCSAGSTESVKPTAWKVHALVYWPVQCRIVTRNNSMAGLTDRVKIESIGAYSVQHWFKWRNPRRTGSTDVLVTSVGAMVMPLSREPVRGVAEALQPLLKPMVQIKRCRCIYVGIVQRACQAARSKVFNNVWTDSASVHCIGASTSAAGGC